MVFGFKQHPPWTGYIDDPRGVQAVVAATLFPGLASIFVALRVWARKAMLGADDYLIVLSLVRQIPAQCMCGWPLVLMLNDSFWSGS